MWAIHYKEGFSGTLDNKYFTNCLYVLHVKKLS